jgi:hypothetical protein
MVENYVSYSEDAYSIYEHLDKRYAQAFSGCDWLDDLQAEDIDRKKFPLLYGLARYNYALGSTESNKQLLDNIS